ncbi:DUF3181 family protein [Leptolyngbya sp. AN02str]|uniref:DUF3181 family protein n=1 Tax=Leptolyngbya sp. AN02str TaxID=3423363 RepID=UPI003D319F77
MAYSNSSEAIEALAAGIGDNVYIDIAKWHLYLRDAKLHTRLAEQFYPMLTSGSINEAAIAAVLSGITISLGGGKREVALADLLPSASMNQLMNTLKDFEQEL